ASAGHHAVGTRYEVRGTRFNKVFTSYLIPHTSYLVPHTSSKRLAPAFEELINQQEDGDHGQDVDRATADVGDERGQPEQQQDRNNSPDHSASPRMAPRRPRSSDHFV